MKNKKILNIWLLTFSLVALITFILPIKKYSFLTKEAVFVKVLFYLLNAIMLVALASIIIMAIINLFKDNYKLVGIMEGSALTSFILVFFVVLCFSILGNAKIHLGYFIVALEVFTLASFSQIIRMVASANIITKELSKGVKKTKTSNNKIGAEDKHEDEKKGK